MRAGREGRRETAGTRTGTGVEWVGWGCKNGNESERKSENKNENKNENSKGNENGNIRLGVVFFVYISIDLLTRC